ncbi:MAG: YcaQ family DNA glycosylase [Microbacteriaceae bacterium]|nr:YcaQ family DNA glycosylase [Microbacteriaceae bacterium]
MTTLSATEARRLALVAQGFDSSPRGTVTAEHLADTIARLGVLQLDSVNVFERSHYLPMFSRLGAYDTALLDHMLLDPRVPATHIEYWAHEAAFIPVESWPLWQWRMLESRERNLRPDSWLAQHRKLADELLTRLHSEGPATFSQLEGKRDQRRGSWWDWSDVKLALEYLFEDGVITAIGRTNFQRIYAPVADVIPHHLLDAAVDKPVARRALVLDAVRALGIGVLSDIADYYRFKVAPTKVALHELLDAGAIQRVTVDGWTHRCESLDAYVVSGAVVPTKAPKVSTILTPFDPITWNRPRASRVFGFEYKIEIYTPAAKRVYGYYSLPILMDETLVGRIDLKADRKNRTLIVKSAHWEPTRPSDAADRLSVVVRRAAAWRGLENISVDDWGDAAAELRRIF